MLADVLERRSLSTLFQPIFSFGESRLLGFEALVRGPEGSVVETPFELFGAAQREGRVVELNIVCIQEVLRAFAHRALPGTLFLNISPQLIVQKGFDQARAARFLAGLGLRPERVVIELTEDYPAFDFGVVRESLNLYRAMGFRVAIDDLGEGFSSLRLWSELKPEFVKADKHFVTGIGADPVKLQFLRAIQQIADCSGARVIAEGIETGEDFARVKGLGIAFGQGYFIGRPDAAPAAEPPDAVVEAQRDARLRVDHPVPRHAHALTRLPGAVPMHEHLQRLLDRGVPFAAWIVDLDAMDGLNDAEGFARGDELIRATGRALADACDPAVDFVGQLSGTRFAVLSQSEDWRARAHRALGAFAALVEAHVGGEARERRYYAARRRDGACVRPLPRLAIGIVPVLPGIFESRREVLAAAKAARDRAAEAAGNALHVDERRANAYPRSYLLASP